MRNCCIIHITIYHRLYERSAQVHQIRRVYGSQQLLSFHSTQFNSPLSPVLQPHVQGISRQAVCLADLHRQVNIAQVERHGPLRLIPPASNGDGVTSLSLCGLPSKRGENREEAHGRRPPISAATTSPTSASHRFCSSLLPYGVFVAAIRFDSSPSPSPPACLPGPEPNLLHCPCNIGRLGVFLCGALPHSTLSALASAQSHRLPHIQQYREIAERRRSVVKIQYKTNRQTVLIFF